jgi:signal transduction histidine kinase/CheY-like chemotaxis protein
VIPPSEIAFTSPGQAATMTLDPDWDGATGFLANDLRLVAAPRKVASGRLAHLLDLAFRAVQASRGGIVLLAADGEVVEHFARGAPEVETGGLERTEAFIELLQCVLSQPFPTRLADLPKACQRAVGTRMHGPFMGVPLCGAGRSRGVLYLMRGVGEASFSNDDEELLGSVGSWLEQANLSEEARLLNRLRVMNQVAQAAAGNLDLFSILTITLRELDRLLPLHVCAVWLLDSPEQPARKTAESISATALALSAASSTSGDKAATLGLRAGLRLPVEQTPFAQCLRDGHAYYADLGCSAQGPEDSALARALAAGGGTSCFAVPLRAGERTVGILQSVCTRPAGFTGEQLQLLYLVADLIGPAISNCQLFTHLSAAYEELRVTQSQLIQAEKMRALGELAGGVAHEFNNALCGVLGFLELGLLNKALDPACRGFLESARVCAMDAAQTVRRVQDFARWRRNELSSQHIALGEFVRETVELIRHKWEAVNRRREGSIRVVIESETAARISGNPAELREVLTNLAFNAVDAMPRGGTLTIRAWSTSSDAFLSVGDTGIGISEAVRTRLFEPFFTTKGERGNGLGLSVVFGIVRRHAGEITVESREGEGAVFTVRLPLAATSASPPLRAENCDKPATARSLRVLCVEDEETIRRFLETGLTRLGHRPRLAADVEEATAALQEEPFDVVLTDFGLPGANGEEMARRVTARSSGTPVVLLTGWADQLQAEKRSMPGIARILSKPVTLETLASTLDSVVT